MLMHVLFSWFRCYLAVTFPETAFHFTDAVLIANRSRPQSLMAVNLIEAPTVRNPSQSISPDNNNIFTGRVCCAKER